MTTPVFNISGTYTDGGSARPVISDEGDILTVDMSSQHRPTASGVVINSDTILVTFPDIRFNSINIGRPPAIQIISVPDSHEATFTAKLQAPGTIRWSNRSTWRKI
jgi:hypothetical protein